MTPEKLFEEKEYLVIAQRFGSIARARQIAKEQYGIR